MRTKGRAVQGNIRKIYDEDNHDAYGQVMEDKQDPKSYDPTSTKMTTKTNGKEDFQ